MRLGLSFGQLKTAAALLCFLLLAASLYSSSYVAYLLFPEIGMVLHSQCANPTNGWNGKIYGFQIWKNAFAGRNSSMSAYRDYSPDRCIICSYCSRLNGIRRLRANGNSSVSSASKRRLKHAQVSINFALFLI